MHRTHYSTIEALESRIAPAGLITAKLVGGSLFISGDDLDNEVTLNQVNAHTFTISSATGDIKLDLPGSADPEPAPSITFSGFKGNVVVNLGDGNDSFSITQLSAGKNLTVDTGAGNDTVVLGFLQLTGNLKIKGGDGNQSLTLGALQINGSLALNLGNGDDTVNAFSVLAKSVSANLGGGDDTFRIQIGSIGGALSVNAGNGANQVNLGASSAFLEVRGKLSVVHGNDALDDSTAIAGTRVKLGSALIQNGNANSATSIAADLLESGPIRVLSGRGDDAVAIGGSYVNVKSIFVQGGEGDNALQVAATILNIPGNVLFNGGSGNDSAIVVGGGTIGGNVSLNLGAGSSNQAAQIGAGPSPVPLTIAKALTVKASSDVSNTLELENVAVNGKAKLDLTNGNNQLLIKTSNIRGALTANLGDGNDVAIIEDSVFDGLFTLLTNGGLDTVAIEVAGTFESRFNKAVKIGLGAGNDSLIVGAGTPTARAVFASKVTFDGGAGTNVESTTNGNIYPNAQPKLISFGPLDT